jgi:hypothetical protein
MTSMSLKAFYLLRSGGGLPQRVRNKVDGWIDHFSAPSEIHSVRGEGELGQGLSQLGLPVECLAEEALVAVERHVSIRLQELRVDAVPFGIFHNGTTTLGRLCYAACRVLRPSVVVETGVAYGVTSAYILQALAENGEGELHSIDLPPLGPDAEKHVGYLVPQEFRNRWNLHIGSSRKLLPALLRQSGGTDIFVHDSLHTYSHMKMEFTLALNALRPAGILIADDVEGNRAFQEALQDSRMESWFAIREKDKNAICGAMRLRDR